MQWENEYMEKRMLAVPVAIPVGLVTAAGYLTLTGGVLTAVSQTAVETKAKNEAKDETP